MDIKKFKKKYDQLDQYMGICFNQDWDMDYETLEDSMLDFVQSTYRYDMWLVIEEMDRLHAENLSDTDLVEVIRGLGCDHGFTRTGYTGYSWLEYNRNFLFDNIKKARPNKELIDLYKKRILILTPLLKERHSREEWRQILLDKGLPYDIMNIAVPELEWTPDAKDPVESMTDMRDRYIDRIEVAKKEFAKYDEAVRQGKIPADCAD